MFPWLGCLQHNDSIDPFSSKYWTREAIMAFPVRLAPPQRLSPESETSLKALMKENPYLSKVGVVELFLSKNLTTKRALVKTSVDALTDKPPKGAANKYRKWVFKAGV